MPTLHLISHTHWDREWYLTFQQFRLKLVHLVDGLLDLLERDKNFKHFMLDGQTITLEDYLLMRPEKEEAIRKFIKQGRLLIGPWYVLPDEFLVSPEATIRNLLQGDRICNRFGYRMTIGYEPDTFGHIGQLPQILRGFGFDTACLWRGAPDLPAEVWWEAPDGSRVFTAHLREGYGNAASLPTAYPEKFLAEIKRLRDSFVEHSISGEHLLLMMGTDHMEPSPNTSTAVASTRGKLDGDRLIHSTLPDYFSSVRASLKGKELPIMKGELRESRRAHLLPGVLSTRMWIKQHNRASETLLEKWVEPFSTFARLNFGTLEQSNFTTFKPANLIRQAWHLLMENHPHDSICGCSIDQVHDEMKVRFDQVDQIGEEITKQSLEVLAVAVNTSNQSVVNNDQFAIVVFNPLSVARTDIVTTELSRLSGMSDFDIIDESGNIVPYQSASGKQIDWVNMRVRREDLGSLLGMIHEGRGPDAAIQEIHFARDGETMRVETVFAEDAEPNLDVWHNGIKEFQEYLDDPTIKDFQIHARLPDSAIITFVAVDVPALGWKTYFIRDKESQPSEIKVAPIMRLIAPIVKLPMLQKLLPIRLQSRGKLLHEIENDYFVVKAQKDGTLNLLDKRDGRRYAGLNRFLDGGDCGDEYNYCPPEKDLLTAARLKDVTIRHSAVQQYIELQLEIKTPLKLAPNRKSRSRQSIPTRITTRILLTKGVPRVDIHTNVENHARDHRLRVHFSAPLGVDHADHDGHFEVVRRPLGVPEFDETWAEDPRPEMPQRTFTDISNGEFGLMVANRGLPEVEVIKRDLASREQTEIALTILRCVGWLSRDDFANRRNHAGPFLATPGAQMDGKWEFDYSIITHAGDWQQAYPQAVAFEVPLRAASTGIHPGALASTGSFVRSEPQEFIVSAVKESEDGRGWVVRGYNITGKDIQLKLTPWRSFRKAEWVNLAEQTQKVLKVARDGSVNMAARGHEIVTVLFRD